MKNLDAATVEGFGDEWSRFDQSRLNEEELLDLFNSYFRVFPWAEISATAEGFDLGCGSGRWAKIVADRVGTLHCIDPSKEALEVAKQNLADKPTCQFHLASVESLPMADDSMDFGYSLGVLHHIPDPGAGMDACVRKLKPGAPFLVYLYYNFENRPAWFRSLWKVSNVLRRSISRLPYRSRYATSQVIAVLIYFPFAKGASLLERLGVQVDGFPLAGYRTRSFYTMRTDALDRFGTRLEHRYSSDDVRGLMNDAGLEEIVVSPSLPYWCAVGRKATTS